MISWCGPTFNPWIGCSKVSPACKNCYAQVYGNRFGVEWGPGKPRRRTSASTWKNPLKWNRQANKDQERFLTGEYEGRRPPRPRVFCASLADWLDPEVPIEWLADLLALIQTTPYLDWLLLTKRPELWSDRLHAVVEQTHDGADMWASSWLDGKAPDNVWLGVTVEDQQRADERIPHLLEIPARVRFLSCEPLLAPIQLPRRIRLPRLVCGDWPIGHGIVAEKGEHLAFSNPLGALSVQTPKGLLGIKPGELEHVGGCADWVIAGGESGSGARPMHPDWARSLRDQCQDAGVAFHFKQWGAWAPSESALLNEDASNSEFDGTRDKGLRQALKGELGVTLKRVGKKVSGRLLDGREWNELPA